MKALENQKLFRWRNGSAPDFYFDNLEAVGSRYDTFCFVQLY